MEKANGGLKDIFSTVLAETTPAKKTDSAPARIVVHGNGNVIAPGGTVHYVQGPAPQAPQAPRSQ